MKEDIKQGELSAEEWIKQESEKYVDEIYNEYAGKGTPIAEIAVIQKKVDCYRDFTAGAKAMETYLKVRLEEENERLKKWLRIANVPEIIIEHPDLFSGKPTEEDIKWAQEAIEKYEKGVFDHDPE